MSNEKPPSSKARAAEVANPNHVEDLSAPMVFVDRCLGGGPMQGDNVTLSFAAKILDSRFNPPASVTKTVLRLVIPKASARELAAFIARLLEDLESDEAPPDAHTSLN
jgi:hypothetical protein